MEIGVDLFKLDINSYRFRLFIIVAVGLLLRLWGIHSDFYHADEPIVVNHALAYSSGDLNPHFFKIPPLASYLLFGLYGFIFIIGKCVGLWHHVSDYAQFYFVHPEFFYTIGRLVLGVLIGVLTIYRVYLLSLRVFLSVNVALLSALFVAVNFLHVRDSHYIYADMLLVFLTVVTLEKILDYEVTRRLKDLVMTGVLLGAAVGAKYNGAILIVPIIVSLCRGTMPGALLKKLSIITAISSLSFLAVNPYALLDFPDFLSSVRGQAGAEGYLGPFYHLVYSAAGSMGWPLWVLMLWGIVEGIRRSFHREKIILSFLIINYLHLVFFSQAHERYALSFVVVGSLFAAKAAHSWAASLLPSSRNNRLVFYLILIVLPFLYSVRSGYLFTQSDTREIAKGWIEQNIKSGSKIALDHSLFSPRLTRSAGQLQAKKNLVERRENSKTLDQKVKYLLEVSQNAPSSYHVFFLAKELTSQFLMDQPRMPFDWGTLKKEGVEYVVIHSGYRERRDPAAEMFYNQLTSKAGLIYRISPYRNQTLREAVSSVTSQTAGAYAAPELFERERNGPILEIYQVIN